ncbi:MAG TPA: cytosine permease, partial [Thermoanaerobaculia bacterium]
MGETADGLVEPTELPSDPRLINADLAPTRIEQRTWGVYHVASLWIGLSVCIPTYMLAAGLVDGG